VTGMMQATAVGAPLVWPAATGNIAAQMRHGDAAAADAAFKTAELGTIGATPAVVNAVVDALVRAGHADRAIEIQMPLTPAKVWHALQ
jgi:hypothetical protein